MGRNYSVVAFPVHLCWSGAHLILVREVQYMKLLERTYNMEKKKCPDECIKKPLHHAGICAEANYFLTQAVMKGCSTRMSTMRRQARLPICLYYVVYTTCTGVNLKSVKSTFLIVWYDLFYWKALHVRCVTVYNMHKGLRMLSVSFKQCSK